MEMDYIDIDQVYDVPDTPDRVASNDKTNKGRVEIEIDSSASAHSKYTHVFGEGSRNQARGKSKLIMDEGLNKRLSFDPIRGPSISKKTDGGEDLKLPLTKSPTSKNAHMFRKAMMGGPSNPGNRLSLNSQRKLKGISPPTSHSSPSREKAVLDLTKHSGRTQIFEMAPSKESSNSIFAPNTYKGKEKLDAKGSLGDNAISPPRVRGLKRLVKNGVTSPHNVSKEKQTAENNSNGSTAVQIEVGSHVSESDCSLDLMKELVSEDYSLRRGRGLKSNFVLPIGADTKNMSSRQCVAHTKDASKTSTSVRDALRSFDGIGGWRNTHTLKVNPPFPAEEKHINQQNERIDLRRLNRVGSSPSSSTLIKRHKQGSGSSNAGGSSSFASIDSDIVVLGSSKEASNVRSKRNMNSNGVGTSSSFIEIDELSPDMRCGESTSRACRSNDDSYAKAMQLEADEMLALELQEQMYNEMSQVGNREIDAHIALALQEEETSEQAFDSTSLPVFRPRDRVTSNTNRRSQSRLSQNPSARTTTRSRSSTPSRLTRLRNQYAGRAPRIPGGRRNSGLPSNMDLDTRMHILEALEAFSDMGVASNAFQVDRDFNENDYEMLLRLDENNHQHAGASVRLINRLPQSTVQNDNTEDCAVCLEKPTVGDVIRHLPCLHKFHKDCIDPWLRRNTSCPVCKSSVT